MEDEVSIPLDGKVLGSLRVVDLKQELEKRGLSKSGSKKDLVKRLKQQLELEKLLEEHKSLKSSGDYDLKLELDAEIEQNEFVQQYLAQQQKRYAERKQEKKLELEATQKLHEEISASSSENPLASNKNVIYNYDESTEVENREKQSNVCTKNEESAKDEQQSKDTKIIESVKDESFVVKSGENEETSSAHVSENENEETSSPHVSENENEKTSSPHISENENEENSSAHVSENISQQQKYDQNDIIKVENIADISKSEKNDESNVLTATDNSETISEIITKCPVNSVHVIQNKENLFITDVSEIKEQNKLRKLDTFQKEVDNSEVPVDISQTVEKDISENISPDLDKTESLDYDGSQSNDLNSSFKDQEIISSSHASFVRESSSGHSDKPDIVFSMEASQCSSVPYSLSDIQLPESPGRHHSKSSKDKKDEKCDEVDSGADVSTEHDTHSGNKIQSNGVAVPDSLNTSHQDEMTSEESETKTSVNNSDSPEKIKHRKEPGGNQQSDKSESSDVESDKNENQYGKQKIYRYENAPSNVPDSEEEQVRDNSGKDHKLSKPQEKSEESENYKSSDSDKYKHGLDHKRKSHDKHRKRNRHNQNRSSSSSHSSDSSPKRRHSKKSLATAKSKSFVENDESNQMSDKCIDDKHGRYKNVDNETEPASDVSPKKRLKIKRDNVTVEVSATNAESIESLAPSKNAEKNTSSSHSASEKSSKQESIEHKETTVSKVPYIPRKVSLSNRKLNRKSLEDKSREPKSKRSKWESFAAGQKSSQTISISTDSLKNWFPDFKLMSESAPAMELDTDEHSLSAVDEKNPCSTQPNTSSGHDISIKLDSASQMDIEDSESQEPNFDSPVEQGPISKIIFIQNLVRPFTLNQLKDLLKQNGKIVEEYFWIDKIKSKCFVMYETEKEAIKARNALNNTRWPSSNPKILSVGFSNEEELECHKRGNESPPKPVTELPVVEPHEVSETRVSHSPAEEHKRKDRDRRREKEKERSKPQPPVREWDKDKIMQDSPESERVPKEEKSKSSEKKEKKESKKRSSEDTPAKLLDDLFQKTKNPPCIYWLPLTEEQAKQKEEAKKLRKLEREKRNQQLKEQEEAERRNRHARSSRRSREKENRKSSTRSRSPVTRRR